MDELDASGNSLTGGSTTINSKVFDVSYSSPETEATGDASLTITNTLSQFDMTVKKVFKNGEDSITSSMTGKKVYIKLKRKVGGVTAADSFNDLSSSSNPVVELDGTIDTRETAAYEASFMGLDRSDGTDFYTYYAVECIKNGSTYVEKTTNEFITLDGVNFKVTNSEDFVVDGNTPQTSASNYVTVTNTLVKPRLDVEKVDSTNHSTKLAGAQFTLKRTKDGSGTNIPSAQEGDNTWTATTASGTGLALFANDLENGTYELVETQAPLGYAMHSGIITFTVTNGVLAVDAASAIPATGLTGDNPYYTRTEDASHIVHFALTIENTAGTELPSTGEKFGLSRNGFGMAGLFLVGTFAALYFYRKRRREDEFELQTAGPCICRARKK